jgi:HNH endonuclease
LRCLPRAKLRRCPDEPWAKVRVHTFENLIALCPNCHRRHHRGEIDSASLRIYKGNLSVVNERYSDYERRVLEHFAQNPQSDAIQLAAADFNLLYLLRDGLLTDIGTRGVSVRAGGAELAPKVYVLTPEGRAFVNKWLGGEDLGG